MFYYKLKDRMLISTLPCNDLEQISEEDIQGEDNILYWLIESPIEKTRRSFCVSDPSLLQIEEGLHLLQAPEMGDNTLPPWLLKKIQERKIMAVNRAYPKWQEVLLHSLPRKWRIHVLGLGDVGGTLITGLRLLGGDSISHIGIYDREEERIKRWEYETNQIFSPSADHPFPPVIGITKEELFDCDMFVFCASVGVPPIGDTTKDVRMIQFEGNCELLKPYAEMAGEKAFQGIFAVVSDPVDLLCKYVLVASNGSGGLGLAPEQIRGYGLGVMHARAAYYAGQSPDTIHYLQEGRAYGPHGQDLIIADSIANYNEDLSLYLTVKARNANLEVRATGFKPYIAPALSSGALSILATIRGEWHYSATFMGGVYMGARNRLLSTGTEIERLSLPEALMDRLEHTYERLAKIL